MIRPPITQKPPMNEFRRELLSIAGLNAFVRYISPGRLQMMATSHMAQKIVTTDMNESYILTGVEQEFGKYTFGVRLPCDAKILEVIERYPRLDSINAIEENPETVVIYEDVISKQQGCLYLPRYFSFHNYFGFPYKAAEGLRELAASAHPILKEGTTLLDSPAVTAQGNYKIGTEFNCIFLSHPAIAEDGFVFRRKALERLKFHRYEVRTAEWGSSRFALNAFGTPDNPKIFMDIGETVAENGMLMAFRSYDMMLAPVEQNINAVRQVDHSYDDKLYANGPKGKVIDIRVTVNQDLAQAGSNLDVQLKKYIDAKHAFYNRILRSYQQARKSNPSLQVSNAYHMLLIKAMVEVNHLRKGLTKVFKKVPIDHFRVEFVIEYEITPSIGFKVTETMGG